MTFNKHDIVLVPFPFVDRAAAKKRPALVLSPKDFCKSTGHTVLAMITTKGTWPFDVEIGDLKTAGLNTKCRIRMKLFTLDVELIDRKIGELGKQEQDRISASLEACVG